MAAPTSEEAQRALERAIDADDAAAVAAAIESGARMDGDVRSLPGHRAVELKKAAALAALIERGLDLELQDDKGLKIVHLAVKSGDDALVRLVVEAGARLVDDAPGTESVMNYAAGYTQPATLEYLHDHGCSPSSGDAKGGQPVHWAAACGRVDNLAALRAIGASVEATDNLGNTAAHSAAQYGRTEVLAYLASIACPLLSQPNHQGDTPAHHAASKGQAGAIIKLRDLGVNVNVANAGGSCPVHEAACHGNTATLEALKAAGALLNVIDEDGNTPLHRALQTAGPGFATALWLMSAKGLVNSRNKLGRTPLHLAAAQLSELLILALLAKGADPTCKDHAGNDALHEIPDVPWAPIAGNSAKEFIVDALQSALHAHWVEHAHRSLLRGAVGTLPLDQTLLLTAEDAATPAQIEAAKVVVDRVAWDRVAHSQKVWLGGGTFATVYAGTLRMPSGSVAAVALKQVLPSAGGAAAITAEQQDAAFWREVVVHHGCSPHDGSPRDGSPRDGIVRCHGGFVRERGGARERVMVLDRCVGSLADALRGRIDAATQRRDPATARAVTVAQRLTWARQLVAALGYLHGRDIVHGDVKSENVLLDGAGSVRVSDLGGAALLRDHPGPMGERGSPTYMCPALALRRSPLSTASDVYSCGVLLWELLSGAAPYSRGELSDIPGRLPGESKDAATRRIAQEVYRRVDSGLRPASGVELSGLAPRGVGDLIAAMWHPEPRMRPSLERVAEALRALSEGAARPTPEGGAAVVSAAEAPEDDVAPPANPDAFTWGTQGGAWVPDRDAGAAVAAPAAAVADDAPPPANPDAAT
jgi:ankyrin repeat protein